jgi:hypothetical protein
MTYPFEPNRRAQLTPPEPSLLGSTLRTEGTTNRGRATIGHEASQPGSPVDTELTSDTLLSVARAWGAVREARSSLSPGVEWPVSPLDLRQAERCLTDIEPDPARLLRGLASLQGSTTALLTAAVAFLDWVPSAQRTPEVVLTRMYLAALLARLHGQRKN